MGKKYKFPVQWQLFYNNMKEKPLKEKADSFEKCIYTNARGNQTEFNASPSTDDIRRRREWSILHFPCCERPEFPEYIRGLFVIDIRNGDGICCLELFMGLRD